MENRLPCSKSLKCSFYPEDRRVEGESYLLVKVYGDCLDSDASPIVIKNGDVVFCRVIQKVVLSRLLCLVGKFVAVTLQDGRCAIKHFTFYDGISDRIELTAYNPQGSYFVPLNRIKSVFVVEGRRDGEGVVRYI